MILRNFILADAVTFGPEGKLFIHGGGVGKVYATHFPWPQPQLAVLATLIPEDEPPGSDHDFTVTFRAPSGGELEARAGGNFRIPPPEREEFRQAINFATQLVGVQFPEEGLYWVRALYDGEELGRLPLEVEQREAGWVPVPGAPS
jgi:hypothetical protein